MNNTKIKCFDIELCMGMGSKSRDYRQAHWKELESVLHITMYWNRYLYLLNNWKAFCEMPRAYENLADIIRDSIEEMEDYSYTK